MIETGVGWVGEEGKREHTALLSPKIKARFGQISPFSVKHIFPGMCHLWGDFHVLMMKFERLKPLVTQVRKLVAHESFHPLAQRREKG